MTASTLDLRCNDYVVELARLNIAWGVEWGVPGIPAALQDYSPEYHEAVADCHARMLADAEALAAADELEPHDAPTLAALRNRLELEAELHAAGEDLRQMNPVSSPLQKMRGCLVMTPQEQLAERVASIPRALAGYRRSLEEAVRRGLLPARRQVLAVAGQAEVMAAPESQLGDRLASDDPGVTAARAACAKFAVWLRAELLPQAQLSDAVGRARYERFARQMFGSTVDLEETYRWGLAEVERLATEQQRLAEETFGPGTTVEDAAARFEADERYSYDRAEDFIAWMQSRADRAIADLDGSVIDIPEEIAAIECGIDPAGTGVVYYTQPAADFSRPGRMFWSVPRGWNTFHSWKEATTVYHEGVPGHHLQFGTALANRELNDWMRIVVWNSGAGEGWGLYAEQLMSDLGYLSEPAEAMGLLDAQRLRAARVVIDLGIHLELPAPDGETWTAEKGAAFLREQTAKDEETIAFEIDRYCGWPAQAPSYAVGQREWL